MDDLLVQVATKVATSKNVFGDIVYGAATTTACLYRDVSRMQQSASNRYGVDVTGILWFGRDEEVERGDVYMIDGEYYKVEEILKARARVTDNALDFIKCAVSRTRQVS